MVLMLIQQLLAAGVSVLCNIFASWFDIFKSYTFLHNVNQVIQIVNCGFDFPILQSKRYKIMHIIHYNTDM